MDSKDLRHVCKERHLFKTYTYSEAIISQDSDFLEEAINDEMDSIGKPHLGVGRLTFGVQIRWL